MKKSMTVLYLILFALSCIIVSYMFVVSISVNSAKVVEKILKTIIVTKHTALKNKSPTYTVEGVNSDLRHYIPALHRRFACFFRSIEI